MTLFFSSLVVDRATARLVFTQGGILKKMEIEVCFVKKKGCTQERNLREIYTGNNVGTTAQPRFLIMTLLVLGAEAIAYWLPA
jgi:hypothetical protein